MEYSLTFLTLLITQPRLWQEEQYGHHPTWQASRGTHAGRRSQISRSTHALPLGRQLLQAAPLPLHKLDFMTDVERIEGLSSQAVEELRQKHGFNEVKTKPVPEWKKLARRYADWISIIIVRAISLDVDD